MAVSDPEDTAPGIKSTVPRFATFMLAFSMFMTGACGLVAEYVMGTVATYILGNSIEQMSVTIAVMLLMMGIASHLQKYLTDSCLIEKFVAVEVAIALLSGFAPIMMFASFSMRPTTFGLVQYSAMSLIGFFIGLEIPLVTRINEQFQKRLKTNIASIWSLDYIGGFVGAIIWVFLLLRYVEITKVGFILGAANLIVAVMTLIYFLHLGLVKKRALTLASVAFAGIALFIGFGNVGAWHLTLEQRLYAHNVIFSHTTKYQHLVMTHNKPTDDYRLYINGNLQFSSTDEAIYHEQLVHPAMSLVPDHRRVLILGGGDGMALREVLKYDDVESVTLVDLDPEITRLFSTAPHLRQLNKDAFADARVHTAAPSGLKSGGRKSVYSGEQRRVREPIEMKVAEVDIFNLDADRFIGEITGRWNVIIIDFPDPNSIELTKLYSKEFYLKLREILSEQGMAVVQSASPYHAREAFLCIRRTMEAAGWKTLPYHDNVPTFGDWGWTMIWKSRMTESGLKEKIDLLSFPESTRYLTPEVFQKALVFGKGLLDSEDDSVNTLAYPVLMQKYNRESWLIH